MAEAALESVAACLAFVFWYSLGVLTAWGLVHSGIVVGGWIARRMRFARAHKEE